MPRSAPPPGKGEGVGNSQPQGCTASAGQAEVEVEHHGASRPNILVGTSSQQRQQQEQQNPPEKHHSRHRDIPAQPIKDQEVKKLQGGGKEMLLSGPPGGEDVWDTANSPTGAGTVNQRPAEGTELNTSSPRWSEVQQAGRGGVNAWVRVPYEAFNSCQFGASVLTREEDSVHFSTDFQDFSIFESHDSLFS